MGGILLSHGTLFYRQSLELHLHFVFRIRAFWFVGSSMGLGLESELFFLYQEPILWRSLLPRREQVFFRYQECTGLWDVWPVLGLDGFCLRTTIGGFCYC